MDQNTEKLAEHVFDKNKFLLLLIGIPVLIAFIRSLIIDFTVKQAHQMVEDAKITDEELARKQAAVRAEAEEIARRLKAQPPPKPVDENWNHEQT